jgi:acyl transferase domain-containing protein/thioesterase domain-containing protein/acyl carrier protein
LTNESHVAAHDPAHGDVETAGAVAIVGMAGRFPGASDVEVLWRRVAAGDDCLVDLEPTPVGTAGSDDDHLVARAGIVDHVEDFDHAFFGIGHRDASIMDPQHRLLLECAWESMEAAGIVPERFGGNVGVFAGCGVDTYLINNLLPDQRLVDDLGWFLLRHTANDKDFLATGISYRLDLHGPSVSVQTACSTSLVAIHLAAQSLLGFECDLALAGGATIEVPHGRPYRYRRGEILSSDGHCRAFDAASNGTVLTGGAAMVALRRLDDALADGDPVLAVIRGSAVNNDGSRKVSYLAPSVDGHADAVREALAVAGLRADDIQLVETHGTGTPVGDPIELAALTDAFRSSTDRTGFCRIVSTKPNIGHLDTAAGVASVIKVVQALRHRTLPPMANFTAPNPLLDLDSSPFTLAGASAPWPGDAPRRAGVSSLGVGGTNAHVIIEEAPAAPRGPTAAPGGSSGWMLLPVTGVDAVACVANSMALAEHLEGHPEIDLVDVAHTLRVGRRHFARRRIVVADERAGAVSALRSLDARWFAEETVTDLDGPPPDVVALFPGGGSQYVGMATGLDHRFATFHDTLSDGRRLVRAVSGIDLAPFVEGREDGIERPMVSLPSVFLTSLALARQWRDWGVEPVAYVGHSLGEYVAAHLCGVIGFDDVIRLVVTRAHLMERATGDAAMLVAPVSPTELDWLPDDVSVAAINALDECTLAGPAGAIAEVAARLERDGHPGVLLPLAAAAHSSLLDPVLDEFRAAVDTVSLRSPTGRYTSNLSGTWAGAEVTSPQYWVGHLRGTVRFAECLDTALADRRAVTVELGPGHALSSYARRSPRPPTAVIGALRHPRQDVDDTAAAVLAFGRVWASGVPVDLTSASPVVAAAGRRVVLPTYRFQRVRCWIDPSTPPLTEGSSATSSGSMEGAELDLRPGRAIERIDDVDRMWFEMGFAPAPTPAGPFVATGVVHVVSSADDPLVSELVALLESAGRTVVRSSGPSNLLEFLDSGASTGPLDVVLVGGVEAPWEAAVDAWCVVAPRIAAALGGSSSSGHRITAVTRGATSDGARRWRSTVPADALALGVVLVAPSEYPDLATRLVDLVGIADRRDAARSLAAELGGVPVPGTSEVIAITPAGRFRRGDPEPAATSAPDGARGLPRGGRILITGGLGGIGHSLAMHCASDLDADVVLVTREPLPVGTERATWLADHGPMEPVARRLRRLAQVEALLGPGRQVEIVACDVSDPEAVREMLDAVCATRRIDAVIHAAGVLDDQLIAQLDADTVSAVLTPKARAAVVLTEAAADRHIPLVAHVSSTSTAIAPAGQLAYVAANSVLDALVGVTSDRGAGTTTVTIGYGVWRGNGMAADADRARRLGISTGRPVEHPVFEEVVEHGDGTVDVIGHLATDQHSMVDHHRLSDGRAVLPGAGHFKLMLQALRVAGRASGRCTLVDVAIEQPLFVPDGDVATAIRVRCTASGVELAVAERDGSGWNDTSRAAWHDQVDAPSVFEPSDALTAATAAFEPFDPFARQRHHLELGSTWKCRAVGAFAADAAIAVVESDRGPLHPTSLFDPPFVDIAIGVGVQCVGRSVGADRLLVPAGCRRVVLHAPVASPMRVAVRRRPVPPGTRDGRFEVDIGIDDMNGNRLVELLGLSLVAAQPAMRTLETATIAAAPPSHSLAELSSSIGLDPDEGFALLDRLVAGALAGGPVARFGSSVDLRRLRQRPAESGETVTSGDAGASSVVDRLAAIWRQLLGVAEVRPSDDFFELGGHSLIAIRLMSRIQRELGVKLQLADIFGAQRLDQLATLVAERQPPASELATVTATSPSHGDAVGGTTTVPSAADASWQSLVCVSSTGERRPLFVVHGAGGNVLFLWTLGKALAPDRPVYGFQAIGIDGVRQPDDTIEAMAVRYVDELVAAHAGPYLLAGYSGGGTVALEMTRILHARGATVDHVVLIDSEPPGRADHSASARLRNLVSNVVRTRGRAIKPFAGKLAAAIRLRVAGISERQRAALVAQGVAIDEQGLDEFRNLFDHFSVVHERHRLGHYDVDATLLKAEREWAIRPYDYAWGDAVRNLDIAVVGGDHMSMFQPGVIERLGGAIRDALDAVDR